MFEPVQKQQLPHILRYPSLTVARWLCARPLPSGLTGPRAASSQYIPCAAAEADPVIVVSVTAGTLSISWYGKQTACDNYSRKRRIINQIGRHCMLYIVLKVTKGIHDNDMITWTTSQCLTSSGSSITIVYQTSLQ